MGEAKTDWQDVIIAQPLWRAQIENLYVEAMVLADEAFAGFAASRDFGGVADRSERAALLPVNLACESLKTTTRLMHVIAWLLHQRAMLAGEPSAHGADSAAQLAESIPADWAICQHFDAPLRRIVEASERLFDRIAAMECGLRAEPVPPPVRQLMAQLAARF